MKERTVWSYTGRAEVRPVGRGILLADLVPNQHVLEDVVPEGQYIARLVFEPVSDQEYRFDPTAMAKLINENPSAMATIRDLADR